MKRLLVLGAGNAQLNLIKESKKLGYYTIVCDIRPEMEGSKIADKYYQTDYMNLSEVYEIALKERIDGVVSNSEPAMVNVAWIANQLQLVGNRVECIETLVSKSQFREFQKRIGLYSPEQHATDSIDELMEIAKSFDYPVIIKPTESTGTQGTSKIDVFDEEAIRETFDRCRSFSRNGQVSIEKFVPMSSLRVIECDVFVYKDTFLWEGMISTYRSESAPMVPMTYIYPTDVSNERIEIATRIIKRALKEAGVIFGEYNVEAYFTPEDELFIIEINPRQGGNRIPEIIEAYSGINYTRLLVSLAVGDEDYLNSLNHFERSRIPYIVHVIYSKKTGVFKQLSISKTIEKSVVDIETFVKKGQHIYSPRNLFDAIGRCVLRFDDIKEQGDCLCNIESLIHAEVE